MERDTLISEIAEYARLTGKTPLAVCHQAVKNGNLYKRLEAGGDCSTGVAARLRKYMADNPAPAQKRRASA